MRGAERLPGCGATRSRDGVRAPLGHQPHHLELLDPALQPHPPTESAPSDGEHPYPDTRYQFLDAGLSLLARRVRSPPLWSGQGSAPPAVQRPRIPLRGVGRGAPPRHQSVRMQPRPPGGGRERGGWFDAASLGQMASARFRSDRRRTSSGFYLPQETLIIERKPKSERGYPGENISLGICTSSVAAQVTGWMPDEPGDASHHKGHAGASYALGRRMQRTGSFTIPRGAPAHLDPVHGGGVKVQRPVFRTEVANAVTAGPGRPTIAGGSIPAQGGRVWSLRGGMLNLAPQSLPFANLVRTRA